MILSIIIWIAHSMTLDSSFHDGQDHSMTDRIIKSGIERDRHYLDSSFHDGQDLSVTIWIAHSMTDRILKSGIELYDPVRHGIVKIPRTGIRYGRSILVQRQQLNETTRERSLSQNMH